MTQATTHTAKRLPAAVAGVVAGAAALGAGELIAGVREAWQSPVVGVAEAVIERVPRSVKDFGVARFGTNDKAALVVGILIFSVIFAVALGLLGRRRLVPAMAGFVAFAVVGAWGSQQRVGAPLNAVLPSLVAGLAGALALRFLLLRAAGQRDTNTGIPTLVERRQFVFSAAGFAGMAAVAAAGGRTLRTRFSAASSRNAVNLPTAAAVLPPAPSAVSSTTPGVSAFFTPNAAFYRIDTAVEVPQIRTSEWSLRIHGMVDKELRLTYDDLLKRSVVEQDITLTCVSNTVGGNLVGTARWLGVPLRDLLDEAGVSPKANQLVGRSSDGWTSGLPLDAIDGRPALVAVGMNGEPLPLEHGFPARVIVSGLYGYVSATKWVTELEVTTFDAFDAYWVTRGWDQKAPIKTMSRIDTPRTLAKVRPGTVAIGGVAWAQTIGISKVEVKIDDGEFVEATLADQQNVNTWRLWSLQWQDAKPGRHRITVRATDADGHVQTEERADPFPNGASGWMSIFVDVTDA